METFKVIKVDCNNRKIHMNKVALTNTFFNSNLIRMKYYFLYFKFYVYDFHSFLFKKNNDFQVKSKINF